MLIHDTKKLRARAKSHAKYDHIKQGTYGSGKTNGKTEFHGCAVGCLSTPHTQKEMRTHIIEHGSRRDEDGQIFYEVNFYGFEQRQWIEEEFGICEPLMKVGEAFFEAQATHGAAIEFVKDFALAFNEGANFTPSMAEDWCEEVMEQGIWDWEDVKNAIYENINAGPLLTPAQEAEVYTSEVERLTVLFLDWIKSVKVTPQVAA